MTPSALIVQAWTDAHGDTVPLWADFVPEEAQQTFPIAAFIHAGFSDDDEPLSGTVAETERFIIVIQALDRRQSRTLARRTRRAIEDLEDTSLSNATASLSDMTVRMQDGSVTFWETRVEASLLFWNSQED